METEPFYYFIIYYILFKSYYVVWKLQTTDNKNIAQAKFKSYYVVWKHDECVYVSREFFLFKSYYVVWKPLLPLLFFPLLPGLNRTM